MIDPGLAIWLACVNNLGSSSIVNGRKVKSFNRQYNRRMVLIKEDQDAGYWDEELAHISEKHNHPSHVVINKAPEW